jgi:hypothetical protein
VSEEIIERISAQCDRDGFPFYRFTIGEKFQSVVGLRESEPSRWIQNGKIQQSSTGLGVAWSYFPHSWSVRCNKAKTAMEAFIDPVVRRRALKSRLKWGKENALMPNGEMSQSNLRKAFRTCSGVQCVSNFRPTAAQAIYDLLGGGVVWDPCAGFGGRLLGAMTSPKVRKYIATDPGTETFKGLQAMAEELNAWRTGIELHQDCAEAFKPKDTLNIVFTSPPYFNCEKYSDEPTQSWKRYNTPTEWNEGFLRPVIRQAFTSLKPKGWMALNLANVRSHNSLESDCVRIARQEGFVLETVLDLLLASITFCGQKAEPVFIFRKETAKHGLLL